MPLPVIVRAAMVKAKEQEADCPGMVHRIAGICQRYMSYYRHGNTQPYKGGEEAKKVIAKYLRESLVKKVWTPRMGVQDGVKVSEGSVGNSNE